MVMFSSKGPVHLPGVRRETQPATGGGAGAFCAAGAPLGYLACNSVVPNCEAITCEVRFVWSAGANRAASTLLDAWSALCISSSARSKYCTGYVLPSSDDFSWNSLEIG